MRRRKPARRRGPRTRLAAFFSEALEAVAVLTAVAIVGLMSAALGAGPSNATERWRPADDPAGACPAVLRWDAQSAQHE